MSAPFSAATISASSSRASIFSSAPPRLENLELPLIYRGIPAAWSAMSWRWRRWVVGLADRGHHTASELSGGQQQRVAIARALVTNPNVIFADEPTGNLDSARTREIMDFFSELNRKNGLTIVMVTHEEEVAAYAGRRIRFRDGHIESDRLNPRCRQRARHRMIGDTILLAIRELRRNLLRALLTTLGIVIGVASVIAMVTLGNGASASISGSIAALGSNVVIISPGAPQNGFGGGAAPGQVKPFDHRDADAVRREIGHLRGVSPHATHTSTAVAANKNHSTQVVGAEKDYFIVHDASIVSGRMFNDAEVRSGKAVRILGETVRVALFGEAGDPVGTRIRVGNVPCEVIGVLTPKGQSTFGQDQDDLLLMPLRAEAAAP